MRSINEKKTSKSGSDQLTLVPEMKLDDLELVKSGGQVIVFCRGFCMFVYDKDDRFSRNYCIVQLHLAGRIKLSCLSELFDLNYQHCSRILSRFKEMGIDGLRESVAGSSGNRGLIDEEVGRLIRSERQLGTSYEEISVKTRFLFKKKIKPESLKAWVYRHSKQNSERALVQLEMDVGQEIYQDEKWRAQWRHNIYAGSMILYALIQRTGFLRPFEEYI